MATPTKAVYNCTQSELYTICNLGWQACKAIIATFFGLNTNYVLVFVNARIAAIAAAAALPDFQARSAIAELIRTDLIAKNDAVLLLMQQLKQYITYSFAATQWQIQWDAAGLGYYRDASNFNWDSTASMLISMDAFITANNAALLAGGMPAAFAASVTTAKTDFDTLHIDYETARAAAYSATEDKINANNQLYVDLLAMFADAKLLGLSYADMASFTFSRLLTMISGGGFSVLQGYVYDLATNAPIAGATVSIPSLGVSTVTDTTGFYQISPLPAATYSFVTSQPGYVDNTTSITLSTGTTSTQDIYLDV